VVLVEAGLLLVPEDIAVLLPGVAPEDVTLLGVVPLDVTPVGLAVPGAVWLVEATEVPEVVVVFCVIGVLLTLPALFLLPQHSQPASVRPAITTPEQAISFFKPMSFPLPQKRVYARPAMCGPSPQPALAVLLLMNFSQEAGRLILQRADTSRPKRSYP
jgi:hypothetical protein